MSIRKMTEVWDSEEPEHGVLLVLLALADWANDDGICWPSIPRIAKRSRLSERHVYRILRALAEDGRLSVENGKGRGNTSRYKLNLTRCQGSTPRKPDIGSTENLTSEALKPDIGDSAIRKEPSVEPSVRTTKAQAPFALPVWIPQENWEGFEEMRKKIRKPMTDRARAMIATELFKLKNRGHPPGLVLDQSTRNCWQDVYELRDKTNGNGTSKVEQLRSDNREAIVSVALESGLRGGHGHNRPAVEVGAVPEGRRATEAAAGSAAGHVAGQPQTPKPITDA